MHIFTLESFFFSELSIKRRFIFNDSLSDSVEITSYVLKQLLFLVSLNSCVSNFYLATIHLDFKEYFIRLLKKLRELSRYIPAN